MMGWRWSKPKGGDLWLWSGNRVSFFFFFWFLARDGEEEGDKGTRLCVRMDGFLDGFLCVFEWRT